MGVSLGKSTRILPCFDMTEVADIKVEPFQQPPAASPPPPSPQIVQISGPCQLCHQQGRTSIYTSTVSLAMTDTKDPLEHVHSVWLDLDTAAGDYLLQCPACRIESGAIYGQGANHRVTTVQVHAIDYPSADTVKCVTPNKTLFQRVEKVQQIRNLRRNSLG